MGFFPQLIAIFNEYRPTWVMSELMSVLNYMVHVINVKSFDSTDVLKRQIAIQYPVCKSR